MSTKNAIAALLQQAMDLLEAGEYTVDGLPASDADLEDCNSEMMASLQTALDTICDYMDEEDFNRTSRIENPC